MANDDGGPGKIMFWVFVIGALLAIAMFALRSMALVDSYDPQKESRELDKKLGIQR